MINPFQSNHGEYWVGCGVNICRQLMNNSLANCKIRLMVPPIFYSFGTVQLAPAHSEALLGPKLDYIVCEKAVRFEYSLRSTHTYFHSLPINNSANFGMSQSKRSFGLAFCACSINTLRMAF